MSSREEVSRKFFNLEDFFNFQGEEFIFSLIYTNIRSARKNFDSFLIEVNKLKDKPQIIILSEIWIGSDECNLFNIPGYKAFYKCNDNYRAGGVMCFVSNLIVVKPIQLEMLTADVLFLDIRLLKFNFKLVCLYRLQKYSENAFSDELFNTFNDIHGNTIFVGDINVDLLSRDRSAQHYHSIMNNNGFLSLINSPTRTTALSESCIDHLFVRHKDIGAFESGVFDVGLTDHCIISLRVKNYVVNSKLVKQNFIDTDLNRKISDFDLIRDKLNVIDWSKLYSCDSVDDCMNIFYDILSNTVFSSYKLVKLGKLDKSKLKSPWITLNLMSKFEKRKKLYRILKRRPYDRQFIDYFHRYCYNLSEEVNNTKNVFYKNKLEECAGDTSQQWRIINNLTGRISTNNVDKIELDNGEMVTEAGEVASIINDYLISVQSGPAVTPVAPGTGNHNTLTHLRNRWHSFFIAPTSECEVKNVISRLKNKKSTGFDTITVSLIKKISDYIAPVLTHIINLSFENGVFPIILKQSTVVPIWKKNCSLTLDNIRPISLLSVFSKIFEKIMKVRLLEYLNSLNFFSDKQFGFVKGKSTEDALIAVTEQIYLNVNQGKKSTGLFVDFMKAFDLVNHSVLLSKLEAAGVRGVALSWFRHFLVGRQQKVKIGTVLSSPVDVRSGVPQGSVISATLFLIFINDLLNLPFKGRINAFADDICIFYSHENEDVIYVNMQHDLALLYNWCSANGMQVNVKKTKYLNFDFLGFEFLNPVKYHTINCNVIDCNNCQVIEQVKSFKYLGVILDEKVTWENHIVELHRKTRISIRTFYYLRNICDTALMRTLYFALIHSRLQYGIICWGGAFKYLIDRLRVTQNFYLRIILKKCKRDSSFALYRQLEILPIQHLFVYKVLRIFYVRSGHQGNVEHVYGTRHVLQGKLRLPKVNKSIFRRSLEYLGPKLFNQLPVKIRLINSPKYFCKQLLEWLKGKEDLSNLYTVLV